MNSLFSFIQFYNKQSDSAFAYYHTKNFMLNQYVYFNSFTMQLNVAEAVNKNYSLYTIGGNIQFKLKKWLLAGGGLKYNNKTFINDHQIGYNMNATIVVSNIGTIQFFAEKAFIPSVSKSLVENKVGRLTFIKKF